MSNAKPDEAVNKSEPDGTTAGAQSKRSWWNWRRSQVGAVPNSNKIAKPDDKDDERGE